MYILFKGVVHPWLCDVMGHLNTRNYVAMFDDACYQLLTEASGWTVNDPQWEGQGWADVSHHIEYKNELKAGTLIEIHGGVRKMGNSSFTGYYEMTDKVSGQLAATMESKVVFFDLVARKSKPLTETIRQQMTTRLLSHAQST